MVSNKLFPNLHRIQWLILRKMISNEEWRFNEIKFEDMDPKKFTYHLKQLQKESLIGYNDANKKYFLDLNGKILMDYFKNIPNFAELPINTSILLHIKRNNKILVVKRSHVPSLNFLGNPSSNTSINKSMLKTAQDLLASFGLSGKLTLSLILEMLYKTKDNTPFTHDLFFIYYSDNVKGVCAKKCEEGNLIWMTPKELLVVEKGYENTKDILNYFESASFDPHKISSIQKSYKRVF